MSDEKMFLKGDRVVCIGDETDTGTVVETEKFDVVRVKFDRDSEPTLIDTYNLKRAQP